MTVPVEVMQHKGLQVWFCVRVHQLALETAAAHSEVLQQVLPGPDQGDRVAAAHQLFQINNQTMVVTPWSHSSDCARQA